MFQPNSIRTLLDMRTKKKYEEKKVENNDIQNPKNNNILSEQLMKNK